MVVLLLTLALLGHVLLWIGFVNRIHSTAWPQWLIDTLMLTGLAVTVLIPAAYLLWLPSDGLAGWGLPYLVACWIVAVLNLGVWTWRHTLDRPPAVLRSEHTRRVRLEPPPAEAADSPEHRHDRLVYLPGNEILDMDVRERRLGVRRLDPRLDGLSVVHLSDLHFTGRVGKAFFRQVAEWANALEPDLVAITGDLIDNRDCIGWIPDTLGRLRGRLGVYFVLGNHDLRTGYRPIRQAMIDAGLVPLGGRWIEVPAGRKGGAASILLAGNELPWSPPAPDLGGTPPPTAEGGPLRILLSHSPDQLSWARRRRFDLMLAGHTHGGQICLPLVGPILSPSRVGVRYAEGIFHEPPTILHVTRGVSGKIPVRWLCPPEIVKLVLCAAGEPATGRRPSSDG